MKTSLPPLRSVQAFEAFGRIGSVSGASWELSVTAGAISQQIKILENYLETPLIVKDGRRASLTPDAKIYHEFISAGFEKLRQGQDILAQQKYGVDVKISGLPTLLLKWLNPKIHRFQVNGEAAIRLEATHCEPDDQQMEHMFRLTYGVVSENFAHSRALFTDYCFPVCSPKFLEDHPQALELKHMDDFPWIDIDWGPKYSTVPRLKDWFAGQGLQVSLQKPVLTHTLSSLALEAVIGGQGITLAQSSFASFDLELGRLVRLSDHVIQMPEPYFVCWGQSLMDQPNAKNFLNWILAESKKM